MKGRFSLRQKGVRHEANQLVVFAIATLALSALLSRVVLTRHYAVPRFIRHHWADLWFAAFWTLFASSVIVLIMWCAVAPIMRRIRKHDDELTWWRTGDRWTHLSMPVIGMLIGLQVEYEDFHGLDDDDRFDPGKILDWMGAPSTETFDWWDVMVIIVGGVLVFLMQLKAVRSINRWRGSPLVLSPPSP